MSMTGSKPKSSVKVFIISLPIGNDGDISYRAKDLLEKADLLIGEESKFLSAFLKRIGIPRQFVLYNEHSTEQDFHELLRTIRNSNTVAFVSDAGLPNLEDPGRSLIPKLYDAGLQMEFCPGASSLDAGLALCGFSTRPFTFVGLLPREPDIRKKELSKFLKLNHTLVILETPYRYKKIVEDLYQLLGKNSNRRIFLGLHLTHPTEQWMYRGAIDKLLPELEKLPKVPPIILVEGK
ncbi:MAG: 16S rRNA methyltransferase [Leptospira sp.]|nr:16S rRNA methyltransferase [Leptospira sp.]